MSARTPKQVTREAEATAYAIETLRHAWDVVTGDHRRAAYAVWHDMGALEALIDRALTTLETGNRDAWIGHPRARTEARS